MRIAVLFLIVALTSCAAPSKRVEATKETLPAKPAAVKKEKQFPRDWMGSWKGDLEVWGGDGQHQVLEMTFEVAKTAKPDRYKWVIGYTGQPLRNYELVVVDAVKGLFTIDEKNSIDIPARYVGGELLSIFSVMGNHLVASYRMEGDQIVYRIVMTKVAPTAKTGGQGKIPTVSLYDIRNAQRAVLSRVKE